MTTYVAAREAYKAEGKNLTAEIVKGLKREVVSEASIGKKYLDMLEISLLRPKGIDPPEVGSFLAYPVWN